MRKTTIKNVLKGIQFIHLCNETATGKESRRRRGTGGLTLGGGGGGGVIRRVKKKNTKCREGTIPQDLLNQHAPTGV